MTIAYLIALRNSMLDELTALIDAGAGAGTLRIYDGVQPATGGVATTLLAELTFSNPSAPVAAAGVWTASAITADSSANAAGTSTWFRVVDSTGAFVVDGTVGLVGTDLILNSVSISIGVNVAVNSMVITGGNP